MTIHILVFPFPAQGHMIPLLDLTDQLLARGITITVLVTPKNLHFLTPLKTKHPSLQTLILPFPTHPLIPLGVENVKDLPHNAFFTMISVMGGLRDPILNWFDSHPSPPIAILSDFFLGWTHQLACQLGIPRVVFSPSGALALSVLNSLWCHMPAEPADGDGSDLISFDGVPNCPVYPWWQLSPIYRSYKKGDPVSEFIRDVMLTNETSWGVVVNTFDELESVYLQHLEGKIGRGRVWAVGPIVPSGPTTDRGGSSKVVATELLSWLDKCQDNSVVYVCFGSQVVMSNLQMEVLALALEKSRVRFVWGVKEPTIENSGSEFGAVPPGFEDGVAGRGLVIRGWVPQVMVLNHRAVGSFLTHCGWNSVLEAIVAGVPMLAWPMGADQYTNAALLIEELRIAIKVCEGRDTVSNANEMAQAMADSLSENQSRKARVLELSRASLNAIQLGGNSSNSLDGFLKELAGLKSVNNSS